MPAPLSLPLRATLIAATATLFLSVLCGCAKETMAPLAAAEPSAVRSMPMTGVLVAPLDEVDTLFERALADRAARTTPSVRQGFAPSL